jgi:hypothetical protein
VHASSSRFSLRRRSAIFCKAISVGWIVIHNNYLDDTERMASLLAECEFMRRLNRQSPWSLQVSSFTRRQVRR